MSNPSAKEILIAGVVGVAIAASIPVIQDVLTPKPSIKLNLSQVKDKPSPVALAQEATGMKRMVAPPTKPIVAPASFSEKAQWGEELFNASCASCHGVNAAGTESGPPLVHDYYRPDHHSDESFYSAMRYGVQAHHWSFGNMPSMADKVGPIHAEAIIAYVRELQTHNGIQ